MNALDHVKCECGHVNPVGTTICESCSNPLQYGEDKEFLDMRYDGVTRRSLTHQRTIVDKIWNFFSSVRVAIAMMVLVLLASIIGSIFPQEQYIPVPGMNPEVYYATYHGIAGQIFYQLGFHNLYTSWWFVLLMMIIGISLIICTLDRAVPLYRALKKQRVKRHASFMRGQRVYTSLDIHSGDTETTLDKMKKQLNAKHYHVRQEGASLLAEKGRFSRWGPYITHIGLILILISGLLRLVPGFHLEEYVSVREGDTVKFPKTNFYVKNVDFVEEYYSEDEFPEKIEIRGKVVKSYQTNAILYENVNASIPGSQPKLVEVKSGEIKVNHPLKYKDYAIFQSGRQINQLEAFNMELIDNRTGEQLGAFKLDLYNPPPEVKINNQTTIKILEYFPDFEMNEQKEPASKSRQPKNPAFIVSVISPATPDGERSWIFLGSTLGAPDVKPVYSFDFAMPDLTDISGLMIKKDKSRIFIYLSSGVVMLGMILGFYWQHRRIWIDFTDGRMHLAAHTNKNWYGFKREITQVFERSGFSVSIEQLKGGKKA